MIRSSVPTKCISWIFDIGDLRSGHFRDLPINGQKLTRAPLGYSAERATLGGGADSAPPLPNSRTNRRSEAGGQILPPLPNSRTNRRSEAGEAAIESPEREDSNAH